MQILSHRGYWKEPAEKNTAVSFDHSFILGYGTETDIRDYKGKLVVSHDIPDEKCISVEQMFEIYNRHELDLPLALNIKSDGLQEQLKILTIAHGIENYFVFDMSVPDTLGYLKAGIPYFTRQSEFELSPPLYDRAAGVWMDSFLGDWIEEEHIVSHLEAGKKVCLVSPELHGRDCKTFWQRLSGMKRIYCDHLMLCTDTPEEAREFFYGKD